MSQPNRATLLNLPAELRLEIYTHAMADFSFDSPRYTVPEHPLLQISQQLRGEAMSVYDKRLTAIIDELKEKVAIATSGWQEAKLRSLPPDKLAVAVFLADHKVVVAQRKVNMYEWWVEKKRRELREVGYNV